MQTFPNRTLLTWSHCQNRTNWPFDIRLHHKNHWTTINFMFYCKYVMKKGQTKLATLSKQPYCTHTDVTEILWLQQNSSVFRWSCNRGAVLNSAWKTNENHRVGRGQWLVIEKIRERKKKQKQTSKWGQNGWWWWGFTKPFAWSLWQIITCLLRNVMFSGQCGFI